MVVLGRMPAVRDELVGDFGPRLGVERLNGLYDVGYVLGREALRGEDAHENGDVHVVESQSAHRGSKSSPCRGSRGFG